jgi:membrane protease YdiL (CAAX protease family)
MRVWMAIILSNLTFAMIHLHVSVIFIVGSFFFGLLLGYMYERHKNLWGVSVAHILVGSWVMFFVGFTFH